LGSRRKRNGEGVVFTRKSGNSRTFFNRKAENLKVMDAKPTGKKEERIQDRDRAAASSKKKCGKGTYCCPKRKSWHNEEPLKNPGGSRGG